MPNKENTNMFENFEKTSRADWEKKVEKDLKGKSLESLHWQIEEHLTGNPLYHGDDLQNSPSPITGSKQSNNWEIGESFDTHDLSLTNTLLKTALEGGVNAPGVFIDKTLSENDFAVLFREINLTFISVHCFVGENADYKVTFNNWTNFLQANYSDLSELKGAFCLPNSQLTSEVAAFLKDNSQNLSGYRFIVIQTDKISPSEQLADLITQTNQTFKTLIESGISPAEAAGFIYINLETGKDFFVEIAKIRAFKLLWANLVKAYGLEPQTPVFLNAGFRAAAMSEEENHNMIAAATMALSVITGGVDRLNIPPAGNSDETFTRRIARNVQHLLRMESFVDKVIDPAAGSYYIEKLTAQLGEKAWEMFKG